MLIDESAVSADIVWRPLSSHAAGPGDDHEAPVTVTATAKNTLLPAENTRHGERQALHERPRRARSANWKTRAPVLDVPIDEECSGDSENAQGEEAADEIESQETSAVGAANSCTTASRTKGAHAPPSLSGVFVATVAGRDDNPCQANHTMSADPPSVSSSAGARSSQQQTGYRPTDSSLDSSSAEPIISRSVRGISGRKLPTNASKSSMSSKSGSRDVEVSSQPRHILHTAYDAGSHNENNLGLSLAASGRLAMGTTRDSGSSRARCVGAMLEYPLRTVVDQYTIAMLDDDDKPELWSVSHAQQSRQAAQESEAKDRQQFGDDEQAKMQVSAVGSFTGDLAS